MALALQAHPASLQVHWQAPLRFITSTALYDGHDAAINVIRRLLVDAGAEVIHLGHNRRVDEIVRAALQEDADAIAVSSYQGGHMEFFHCLIDSLREQRAQSIQVFAGGGGTITHAEARTLEHDGVSRVYTADDGLEQGLQGLIDDIMERTRRGVRARRVTPHPALRDHYAIARTIHCIEQHLPAARSLLEQLPGLSAGVCPVVGITGTGGAGKSSLIDELLERLFRYFPKLHVACLTIDPTRHASGGALLGDRIRINNAGQLARAIFLTNSSTVCRSPPSVR